MNQSDYKAILDSLTLEEKASLCSGLTFWKTAPVDRVGIPSVLMTDGPHGVRHEQESVGTNIMNVAHPATCFPPAVTTASSWDPALAEAEGKAIAEEAKAQKITTVLGPGVNIKRSPLCGRNFAGRRGRFPQTFLREQPGAPPYVHRHNRRRACPA